MGILLGLPVTVWILLGLFRIPDMASYEKDGPRQRDNIFAHIKIIYEDLRYLRS